MQVFILDNESCSYAEAEFCQALATTQLKWEFRARLEDLECQAKSWVTVLYSLGTY